MNTQLNSILAGLGNSGQVNVRLPRTLGTQLLLRRKFLCSFTKEADGSFQLLLTENSTGNVCHEFRDGASISASPFSVRRETPKKCMPKPFRSSNPIQVNADMHPQNGLRIALLFPADLRPPIARGQFSKRAKAAARAADRAEALAPAVTLTAPALPTISLRDAVDAINARKAEMGEDLVLSITDAGRLRAFVDYGG